MKYLLVLIVLLIAYNVWRKQRIDDRQANEQQRRSPPAGTPRIPQQMVPCARCGLMLPQSDALERDGRHFCCAEHREQGPA